MNKSKSVLWAGRIVVAALIAATALSIEGCGYVQQAVAVRGVMTKFDAYNSQATNEMKRVGARKETREKSFVGVLGSIKDFKDVSNTLRVYRDSLGSIDASKCPEDFQAAFKDYYSKIDRAVKVAESLDGTNGLMGVIKEAITGLASGENTIKEIEAAEKRLREVAKKYGYGVERR